MNVQLPVQLPCNWRAASVSATPRLPIWEWHAYTRAAHSPHGIGVRKGRKRPRHADMRIDIEQRTFGVIVRRCMPCLAARGPRALASVDHHRATGRASTHRRPSYGLRSGLPFPCASRSPVMLDCPSHNPLQDNETHRRHHLLSDQKGIYARVSNHVFHTVEAVGRGCEGQALGATEALAQQKPRFIGIEAKVGRVGWGWGEETKPLRLSDLPIRYSAAFPKIRADFSGKTLALWNAPWRARRARPLVLRARPLAGTASCRRTHGRGLP